MTAYTEDNLVQKTTAEYLVDELGWDESVYAMNETLGLGGTLGRVREDEVILERHLLPALKKLNPGFDESVYRSGAKTLAETSVTMGLDAINREKYDMLRKGIPVSYTAADGSRASTFLRVFDFDNPAANHFLCVREFWVAGTLGRRRRADVVGFVNGVPLVFMELKNVHRDIFVAYRDNFCDYRKVVPQLFHFNAFVILANGIDAKIGTQSAKFKFFHAWKRLSEEDPGVVDMETLAFYDLLRKPDLTPAEIARVKKVAKDLLDTLKADKLRIEHWQEKELARDGVRRAIGDSLYGDETGLPPSYSNEEVDRCAETVYRHIFERYPVLPSPYYGDAVA